MKAAPAVEGPGPWKLTMGNYCNDWQRNSGNDTRWCYVSPSQQCRRELMEKVDCLSSGSTCIKSRGPCTDSVDSRSLMVAEALEQMDWPLIWAAVLGTMLVLSSVCAIIASRHNQKMQDNIKRQHALALIQDAEMEIAEASVQMVNSDSTRFEDAQREAVRKLKDSTPSDIKFLLYGYYMQATEGDVRGRRPNLVTPWDRAKWDAWSACMMMTREEAIDKYVKCV